MEEIAKELLFAIKWIPEDEKNSKWFQAYLDKVNKDLKSNLKLKQ